MIAVMTEPPSVSFESVFILGEHRFKKKKKRGIVQWCSQLAVGQTCLLLLIF